MGFLAAALPYISAASAGLSAIGSIAQGQQQAAAAKYNAGIASNNAQIAQQNASLAAAEGAENAAIESQKTRAQVGGIKAAQAANNLDVNTGSAVDVQSSAAELGELNAITIRSNAAKQAYNYQTQAVSDQAQAALDRQQASYDTTAGYLNAGTTLIGGAAKIGESTNWNNFLNSSSMNGVGGNYTNSFAPIDNG